MTHVVREYARLTTDTHQTPNIDRAVISQSTFDWLLALQLRQQNAQSFFQLESPSCLKLRNFVGYLQSPCGEDIEVLPKTERQQPQSPDSLRKLLQQMMLSAMGISPKEASAANLLAVKQPLHEWIYQQFLNELVALLQRGLRFEYQDIEEESYFVRGQLQMQKQMRQPPHRAHKFHIRHNDYSPNRIENRLLKTALEYVAKNTKNADNWRLANNLNHQLLTISTVPNPMTHFDKWMDHKFLLRYRQIKPWCKLILERLNPSFQKGQRTGIALLLPMEQLFEKYVGSCLRKKANAGYKFKEQVKSEFLLSHTPENASSTHNWFALRPDFYVEGQSGKYVLDAKWKLLNASAGNSQVKYGISQADLYQLYAYGQKYLNGEGNVMLIYPKHDGFNQPLPKFRYDEKLSLWCIPFDLCAKKLVTGDWQQVIDCFS